MKKQKKSNKLLVIIILILIVSSIVVIIKGKKSEKNNKPIDNKTTTNISNTTTTNNTNNTEVNEKSAEKPKGETKTNKNKEFNEIKSIKGFKISDISFSEADGKAVLKATVTNTSGKDIKDYTYFKITFLDKDDEEIGTIPGIINPVEKNDKTELKATIRGKTEDYINAYNFKITVDKK